MDQLDQVLSLSLRPRSLEQLIGQDDLIKTLKYQLLSKRIPHFFLVVGPIGVGKTTISRILALILQSPPYTEILPWSEYKNLDILEINAANRNGIDEMRQLIDNMRYKPMPPSKAKVVILDEAHQLTQQAQNALLTETEEAANHVFYIFCTSNANKIIPALRRRAYHVTPAPLAQTSVGELLQTAVERVGFKESIEPLQEALVMHDVSSPGLVLQAAERFFGGMPAFESVFTANENFKVDTMTLCRCLAKGDWKGCAMQLKDANKSDVLMLKSLILGYLKTMVLKSAGIKATTVARAINVIISSSPDENVGLTSLVSSICLACDVINHPS